MRCYLASPDNIWILCLCTCSYTATKTTADVLNDVVVVKLILNDWHIHVCTLYVCCQEMMPYCDSSSWD